MGDGRTARIVLADDRQLDITVQPKQLASDLFDRVASHFDLKQMSNFGLAYKDSSGTCYHWLTPEKRVLDHDFLPRSEQRLTLYFQIRYYVKCISSLRDCRTIELFYAQARLSVATGLLTASSRTVFELAALVLQRLYGDFIDEPTTRCQLKRHPLLPVATLKEHPSISYCEDQVICSYKKLAHLSHGAALVRYMVLVQGLSAYGVHFYEVKDKGSIPWCLGLGYTGITVYDYNDRTQPRKEFPWKDLEHLYYRDKKFSIQVYDNSSSANYSRISTKRPFSSSGARGSSSSSHHHSWFTTSSAQTRSLWTMAVSQHQYYLQSDSPSASRRSLSDLSATLTRFSSPHPTGSLLNKSSSADLLRRGNGEQDSRVLKSTSEGRQGSVSSLSTTSVSSRGSAAVQQSAAAPRVSSNGTLDSQSLTGSISFDVVGDRSDIDGCIISKEEGERGEERGGEMARREGLALAKRKKELEVELKQKQQQLCDVCLLEFDLTGVLPQEYSMAMSLGVSDSSLSSLHTRRRTTTSSTGGLVGVVSFREMGEKTVGSGGAQRRLQGGKKRSKSFHRSTAMNAEDLGGIAAGQREEEGVVRVCDSVDATQHSNEIRMAAITCSTTYSSSSLALNNHIMTSPFVKSGTTPSTTTNANISASEIILSNAITPTCDISSPIPSAGGDPRSSIPPNSLPLVCSWTDHSDVGVGAMCGGYVPSSVYSTRTQYRDQTYPTFASSPNNPRRAVGLLSSSYISSSLSYNQTPETLASPNSSPVLANKRALGNAVSDRNVTFSCSAANRSANYYDSSNGMPGSQDSSPKDRSLGGAENTLHSSTLSEPISLVKYGSNGVRSGANQSGATLLSPCASTPTVMFIDCHRALRRDLPRGTLLSEGKGEGSTRTSVDELNNDERYGNLYNTSTLQAVCYDSADELKTPSPDFLLRSTSPQCQAFRFAAKGDETDNREKLAHCQNSLAGMTVCQNNIAECQGSSPVCKKELAGCHVVQKYETHVEISKPFEMSDVYRYSERLRKERQQRSPQQLHNDSSESLHEAHKDTSRQGELGRTEGGGGK